MRLGESLTRPKTQKRKNRFGRRPMRNHLQRWLSNMYVGHFSLAATKLKNTNEAYEVLETARVGSSLKNSAPKERHNIAQGGAVGKEEPTLTPVPSPARAGEGCRRRGEGSLPPGHAPRAIHIAPLTGLKGAAVTVLPAARKPIEHLVETYVADVRLKKSNTETGKDLYSHLVRPIPGLESKPRLIIVPDGKLHLLPFSSLPNSQGRYLLESHIVTYAPSATVLYP